MAGQREGRLRCERTFVGGGGFFSSVLNRAIDLLPIEIHFPSYNYCGPGTKLSKRLARGDKGINPLDEACKLHDIEYSKYSDSENRRRADKELAERAWQRVKSPDASLGEKAAAWTVTTAMKAKTVLGGGKKRKRTTQSRKTKGGKGLFLKPYKGSGGVKKPKKKKRLAKKKTSISIPIKPLTNHDLTYYAKILKISHFRGVFMRDSLPKTPNKHECGIVNLDSKFGTGTHWVSYKKSENKINYFDSFGNLHPPYELVKYFGPSAKITYNYERIQSFDSVVCGHLCLKFLCNVLS